MRITGIEISGKSSDFYELLDTKDKIESRIPDAGQGMRCSIPIVDESTGQNPSTLVRITPP